MRGLQLAARYSWDCEKAKLLRVSDKLRAFAKQAAGDPAAIEQIIASLDNYVFYEHIAQDNGKDVLSLDVVQNHWRGNALSGEWWHNYTTLLPLLPVPMRLVRPELAEECLVRAGRVMEINDNRVSVICRSLTKNGGLAMGTEAAKTLDNVFGIEVAAGEWVAFHFSNIAEKISETDAGMIFDITEQSLQKFNREHKAGA